MTSTFNYSLVGQKAVDFTHDAVMADNSISSLNLQSYLNGSRGVLIFYPLDFTFVCPSELIACNNRFGYFSADKNTKLIAISIDSVHSHLRWRQDPPNKGGIGEISFPLVGDIRGSIINSYGMMSSHGIAFRGTVIIDTDFIVRHVSINDLPIGRNIDEILRILDAIDFHKKHGEVCPAGWKRGEEGMSATHQGVSHYLSSNADKL